MPGGARGRFVGGSHVGDCAAVRGSCNGRRCAASANLSAASLWKQGIARVRTCGTLCPMFALVLSDPEQPARSTVQVFNDPVLWEWLRTPTVFDPAETVRTVELPRGYVLPGTGHSQAQVRAGSDDHDRMMAAAEALPAAADVQILPPAVGEDSPQSWLEAATTACLTRGVEIDHIAYGAWH